MVRLARWPDLRLRTKGLVAIAAPAAATIIIASASYVIGSRAAEAEREVTRSLQVREQVARLQSSEVEASAHVRGYFITGEEAFAAQARQSIAAFDSTWQNLADLTADHPAARSRLERIATIERSRVARIIGGTTRFQWGALNRDQLRTTLKEAEAERLLLENLLKVMDQEEEGRLEYRLGRVDALRAGLRCIAAICGLLGVAGGVIISILYASGITNRIGALQRNVARLATGGILESAPAGRDEIGALSEGMVKAAEILRRRTAALENAAHGIAEVDASGSYVNCNRVYSQLTGLNEFDSPPTLIATVHPDHRTQVEEAVSRMWECGRTEVEARLDHPSGQVVHVSMTFVPVSETPDAGYFVFLRDISRRKEAESALVQAKDDAVACNLAKSEFLAKISHDIRTPLNAILGAADLLSESALDSSQAECVSMFQRNCRRLVALINDFLDFSKVEAGALRVENVPYRVRETVEEAVTTFRDSAYRKGVLLGTEIGSEVPECVLGDPLRVHQVLVNLLSNAIKFTQRGRVGVDVAITTGPEGEQLRFAVSDTGPGIPAEDRERIFAAFAQSGRQDLSARDGCGLGLAICRELVELMGGKIGVTSEAGSGSTFHFTLPLVTGRHGDPVKKASVHTPNVKPWRQHDAVRILVAEDTEDNRRLLGLYLRDEPVEVQFVENGQEAVDAIRRGAKFDLILMDLDMPVLDGLGATRAIRAWEDEQGDASTPIVALSAHAMREAVRKCLDAGCSFHLAKPLDRPSLLRAIGRYARRIRPGESSSASLAEQVAALGPRYLASKAAQIEEARANLAAGDFPPIRRFGHNLKGTGAGYGFHRIGEIGAEIEKAAAGCDERGIAEQLEALGRALAEQNRTGTLEGAEANIRAE